MPGASRRAFTDGRVRIATRCKSRSIGRFIWTSAAIAESRASCGWSTNWPICTICCTKSHRTACQKPPEDDIAIDAPPRLSHLARHSHLRSGATTRGRARRSEKVDDQGEAGFYFGFFNRAELAGLQPGRARDLEAAFRAPAAAARRPRLP